MRDVKGVATVDADGLLVSLRVPFGPRPTGGLTPPAAAMRPAGDVEPPAAEPGKATHALGFASINWFGKVYAFTPKQRAVVSVLWQAWKDGSPFVGVQTLMHTADSDGDRLRDIFDHGKHPAFNTVIVQGNLIGGPVGSYCLKEPG